LNQLIVAYDIVSDRRRAKLCELLKDYGNHVQYSVFECELTDKQLAKMVAKIKKLINPKQDSVKIYFLSASKNPNRLELGTVSTVSKKNVFFFD
jgi:CRISPR-associated protein Cas2